ncbi:centrosomal protein of 104 kDa isoform X2 [Cylas formicarius]|nr:centrosomal protein of 104 kDa isoform X2 [Cylas formicarius]
MLSKIQILAHQYLIPSKIELYSSNEDTNIVKSVANINWDYIGYITLSNNETTEFKSRELKSANVPKIVATFMKLNLHDNHSNPFNIHEQVSLIAINVLGTDIEGKRTCDDEKDVSKLEEITNNPDYTSPYDDLAFEMYVATDVAKIIRDMEIKKYLAVTKERFEYARKLKHAMLKLKSAGEKLGKYELEKRHAIELEDYDRARHKKDQIEDFRNEVFQELRVEELLETNGPCPKNDECAEVTDNRHLLSPTAVKSERRTSSPSQVSPLHAPRHQSPKMGSPSTGSPTSMQNRGSFRRRNKSAGAITKSTYEMYEEKPLPALRHSQTNEFLRECQLDQEHKSSSKLTEREKKQASLPILVFGNELVERFYSKHYADKEEGLNRLKEELLCYDSARMHTANKTARAAIFLLHRSLRDKVFTVYSLANEVIRIFFVQFVPGRVAPAEVSRSVDKVLPELLTKSGDTSARIHHMAVHTILTMADVKCVRELHIIPVHLSRPVSSSTHPRLALSRAEMVEQLIINHGISTDKQSGLTCRTLSEFGASGLHHPAEAVRKVSERILVLVYKVNPRMVRKQLPPDDDITRRNLLYRQLFHEFDNIDLRRKQEALERNRIIQQCSVTSKMDCFSPEPDENKSDINRCISTDNMHPAADTSNQETSKSNSYVLAKSLSGGNLAQTNGVHKAGDKQSSSSTSAVSSPSGHSQKGDEDKHCIFCGQTESEILSISNSMNSHYWRSCLMLVRCSACNQVVEVAALTDHLVTECEQHLSYTQCSGCTEAVKIEKYQEHRCKELTEGCTRCPLCHEDLDTDELCWKNHFTGQSPCTKNTRIKSVHSKQVKIQV